MRKSFPVPLSKLSLFIAALLSMSQPSHSLTVTATNDDGHVAQNTIDGNLAPDSRWSSLQTNATLTFDFEKLQLLDSLQIAFYNGDQRAFNFDVQVSKDGTNWTKQLFSGYNLQKTNALQTIPLSEKVDARYMRVIGHGNTQSSWNSYTEVKPLLKNPVSFTSQADLKKMFFLESSRTSGSPYPNIDNGSLSFSALTSKYDSGAGHGYREELRQNDIYRKNLKDTKDHFSATITPHLSNGARTIVSQYHIESLSVLMMIYVQDEGESTGIDHIKGNGVFDVLLKVGKTDGSYSGRPLGTIKSGESFDLKIDLVGADLSVGTVIGGKSSTENIQLQDPGKKIYFKFGDYLQAYKPDGSATTKASDWEAYYKSKNITVDKVDFTNVKFVQDK